MKVWHLAVFAVGVVGAFFLIKNVSASPIIGNPDFGATEDVSPGSGQTVDPDQFVGLPRIANGIAGDTTPLVAVNPYGQAETAAEWARDLEIYNAGYQFPFYDWRHSNVYSGVARR